MRIVSLELENTKSYTKGKIHFTDGVNAIVGHNGAGKSTVLEAIGFALFDCLAGYKQSDFVREGAKSAEIKVTIVSGLDERSYEVVRRCGSSNLHAIYDPDLGSKLCEGKADVLHFLRQHMGVDPTADLARLFSDAVGVPQGTFTAAFLYTPAQRKTIFDPLLQVEEYKQAFDKLLEPLRALQQRHHTLEVEMAGYQGRLERLPLLETTIAERAKTLTQTAAKVATIQEEAQQATAARSAMDELQQQVAALRVQQQQAVQQLTAATTQLAGARAAHTEAQSAAATVEEHQAAYDGYLTAQQQQKTLETALRARQQLERRQSALDKTLSLAAAELARYTQELQSVDAADAQVLALAPAVAEQETLETLLQGAQQQSARLEDAQTQLNQLEADCRQREQRLVRVCEQLTQAATVETERLNSERAGEALRSRIDAQKEALARYKAEADALKEQSATLETIETARCPVCEQPLTPDHRAALQKRNGQRLAELRETYRTEQQRIKADETVLATTQQQLKTLQQQLRTLPREEEQQTLTRELSTAQAAVATQRERVQQYADAPAQVRHLTEKLSALGDPRQQQAVAKAHAARRATLETQRQTAAREHEAAQSEMAHVRTEMVQFAKLDGELAAVAADLQRTLNGYQQVLRHQQIAATLTARTADVARAEALLRTAEDAAHAAEQALAQAAAAFDQEAYQQLLGQEQLLRNQQNTLQTELALLQREQAREEEERAHLRRQQAELSDLLNRQQQLRQQTEVLEALRNLLRQAGPYITKALIKQISDGAMQVFSDIMQDYTRHLSWNEDYGITLEVDGRERQFAQLSGGEQMTAALAVRLALLREMSTIDVAFFDEPTTNLDETRRDALARQILEVKGFRQLFIISHDDTFEQATQNLIRITRINGISTVQQS
jgi:exonuclease SbcC